MKRPPPLLIVADRGQLLVYTVKETPRGPSPVLVSRTHFMEGQQRLSEQVTDQAGAFPNGGTNGQGNSIAERMNLVAELEMRTFRQAAGRIIEVLQQAQPESWGFAAPSEINAAILDGLPGDSKARLRRNVKHDLVNTPPAELLEHFLADAT